MPRRGTFFLLTVLLWPLPARAQTDGEVEAARKLFAEGFADENAGRCTEALEKYRRVQAVKDTANIRFRVGSCSEKGGQLRAAMHAYDGAIRLGRGDPQAKDVAVESQKRIDALTPKMGRLRVNKPEGALVRVDEEALSDAELAEPLWLEPGRHAVTATAPSRKPFHTDVAVKEQATTEVTVTLESDVPPPPPPPPPPPEPSHVSQIVGWSLVGLGGALGIGGGIAIAVRETSIASIHDACRSGCPLDRQSELQSTRERALVAGPLAAVLIGAGGAALATGVILLLTAPKTSSALVPIVTPSYGGVSFQASF